MVKLETIRFQHSSTFLHTVLQPPQLRAIHHRAIILACQRYRLRDSLPVSARTGTSRGRSQRFLILRWMRRYGTVYWILRWRFLNKGEPTYWPAEALQSPLLPPSVYRMKISASLKIEESS